MALILSSGHDIQKHLNESLISNIIAVLGSTIALRNPNRLPFVRDNITDIIRQFLRTTVEILNIITWTLHLEHLVALPDIYDQLIHHQVSTEGYLRGIEILGNK